MDTETPAPRRPRAWLVAALGVAVVAAVAYALWPAAGFVSPPSNQQRSSQTAAAAGGVPPGALAVRLDELDEPAPEPPATERNPFRFQPKPPPAPVPRAPLPGQPGYVPPRPTGPPPPPPIPPIPLKFIGILEGRGPGKVAIFSDNRGTPVYGREGDIILGQYRIVKIGVESVVMEYADGRGRQTIPLRGQ